MRFLLSTSAESRSLILQEAAFLVLANELSPRASLLRLSAESCDFGIIISPLRRILIG